jgi:hypothetical protein
MKNYTADGILFIEEARDKAGIKMERVQAVENIFVQAVNKDTSPFPSLL